MTRMMRKGIAELVEISRMIFGEPPILGGFFVFSGLLSYGNRVFFLVFTYSSHFNHTSIINVKYGEREYLPK
ncbi:hypothetical protein PAENIP36_55750 [Paenibacillus sp. P36]